MEFVGGSVRPGPAEASLSGGTLSLDFPASAGSASVDLEASGKWTASFVNDRAKDWCTLSATNGKKGVATLTVSVSENGDYDQRSATINFVCGDVKRSIIVTQKQRDALLVTSNRLEIGAEGGNVSAEVKTNISFSCEVAAEDADWIKLVQTKSLETKTLVFQVSENTRTAQREGTVRISSSLGQELIKIYQKAMVPSIVLGSTSATLSSDAATFEVEVSSNVDVTVRMPSDAPWLKEMKTKSMSTNRYVFSVDANAGHEAREAKIEFVCPSENLSESFLVHQAQKDAVVISGNSFEMEAEGGILEIKIGHNINYSISVRNKWIHNPTTKSFVEDVLLFEVEANPSVNPREGTISVTSSLGSELITVKQKGQEPYFRIIPPESDTVSYEAGNFTIYIAHNVGFRNHYGGTMDIGGNFLTWENRYTDISDTLTQMSVSYSLNKTRNVRGAVIYVHDDSFLSSPSTSLSDTLNFYQAPVPIIISESEVFVPSVASEFSFRTAEKTTEKYRVENEADWVQLISCKEKEGGAEYRWKTKDYVGSAMREAQIKVYLDGFEEPDVFHVYQEGSGLSVSVTYSSKKVRAPYIFGTFAEQSTLWWGDGNSVPYAGGTEHSYNASGNHTITITTNRMQYIDRAEVKELEEGMHIDFSKMRGQN